MSDVHSNSSSKISTITYPYKSSKKKYNKNLTNKSCKHILFLSIIALLLSICFVLSLKHAYLLGAKDEADIIGADTDATIDHADANDGGGMHQSSLDTKHLDDGGGSLRLGSKKTYNKDDAESKSNAPVIAYAISLTSCSETPSLVDGAAILAHSIHLNSIRNTNTKNQTPPSKYDYKLYAFFHTSIITNSNDVQSNQCASILSKLGFEIKIVDIPVPLNEIQSDFLRAKLPENGCCGEKEFIKLWSYTLTDHPFVVHLDLDTIVLKPMDEIFDYALYGTPLANSSTSSDNEGVLMNEEEEEERKRDVIMWKKEERNSIQNFSNINAFFTRDYNMRPAGKKPVGVQGGFLIVRPSMDIFSKYQSIIREGHFTQSKGWGNLGYQFYGAMTFQGIIPYFYDIIQPNTSIELNRCMYNVMADNPRDQRTVNNIVNGKCRDGRKDCEDCRERSIDDVRTAHFTLCQKPWECLSHDSDVLQHRLCRKLFGEWYKVRADLELSWVGKNFVSEENEGNVVIGSGKFQQDHFRGFCKGHGRKGYIPMELHQ